MHHRRLISQATQARWAVALCSAIVAVAITAPAPAQPAAAPIPPEQIAALRQAMAKRDTDQSPVRQRLALKKLIRQGEAIIADHPESPDRFDVLAVVFEMHKAMYSLDDSASNRAALFDTAERLLAAPADRAALRLGADLLLTERALAAKRASEVQRIDALGELLTRFRDTPAERDSLKLLTALANKQGLPGLLNRLERIFDLRFPGDHDAIVFRRTLRQESVINALVRADITGPDGSTIRFPIDRIGHSTFLYVWSTGDGFPPPDRIAFWQKLSRDFPETLTLYSLNVDGLPDAGASILKEQGLDWVPLRLPGGKDNPLYRVYPPRLPARIYVSPTGYTMVRPSYMPTVHAVGRYMRASPQRYHRQVQSLAVGEFLVVDPLDPLRPVAGAGDDRRAIQACFPPPPQRYRVAAADMRANYQRADRLCRQAIDRLPDAPDAWFVRNRRIVALMGLWNLTAESRYLEQAAAASRAALDADPPAAAQLVPRFCLAKQALRRDGADPAQVLQRFRRETGGDGASELALAAAAVLAVDAGVPELHERYRRQLLDRPADDARAWGVRAALRDRLHRMRRYRVAHAEGHFTRYRDHYWYNRYRPEPITGPITGELTTLDGRPFRLPADIAGKWAVMMFVEPGESAERLVDKRTLDRLNAMLAARPAGDAKLLITAIADDPARVRSLVGQGVDPAQVLVVPGGLRHPLIHRLGVLSADVRPNLVIVRPDGTVASVLSGLVPMDPTSAAGNVLGWHDDQRIARWLSEGRREPAEQLAAALAPADAATKSISTHHLRARARVRMARGEWDAALADLNEVVGRLKGEDARMFIRTQRVADALRLRAEAFAGAGQPGRAASDRQAATAYALIVDDPPW